LKLLAAFFSFGAAMCLLTVLALAFPGGVLEPVWRLKPEARADFQSLGNAVAFLLMGVVGLACAASAFGLVRRERWGGWLAMAVLTVNLIGDGANAFLRDDPRTLIGLPIGGALIFYLRRAMGRPEFGHGVEIAKKRDADRLHR